MTNDQRRPGTSEAASEQSTATTTVIMTRPGDQFRARRIRIHHTFIRHRRWVRELDRLVAVDPWTYAVPLDDAGWPVGDIHHDGGLDVPERDHRGRELLTAGWSP